MKKFMPFLIVFFSMLLILFFIVLFLTHSFFYSSEEQSLELPSSASLSEVRLESGVTSVTLTNQTDIDRLWSVLDQNRKTKTKSYLDTPPNGVDYIWFRLNSSESYLLHFFAYEYEGKYYLEIPYNGVYDLTQEEYRQIEHFLK